MEMHLADPKMQDIYDTIRIPMTGPTVRPSAPSSYNGTPDQCFINCFPQSSSSEGVPFGEKEVWIVKRPGIEKVSIDLTAIMGAVSSVAFSNIVITQLNDIYVAGIYDLNNTKFVIVQYRPITGTSTKIGEITGVSGFDQLFLTELTIANVATLGVVWNSQNGTTSKGYFATSAAGVFTAASLTEIVDVDFPPKRGSPLPLVGPMIQMNGTTYVMTNTGEVVNSDFNQIASWNGLGTVQAISYPDQGVGLLRYKNYILAFGEDSIEFFSDVGNPSPVSPLIRQEQAFIKFGAVNAKSIVGVDDTVYWLGRSSSGSTGLWKLDGFTPVKLSGVVEDQIMEYTSSQFGQYQSGQLCPISVLGQKCIIIGGTSFRAGLPCSSTAVNGNDPHSYSNSQALNSGQLTYNIAEKIWWGYRSAVNANFMPLATAQYQLNNTSASTQYILYGGTTPGTQDGAYIYKYGVDTYFWTDTNSSGTQVLYAMVAQNNRWMVGNEQRKRVHKYKLILDPMYSDSHDAETGATLWFFWAKDAWDPNTGVASCRGISVPNTTGRYYVPNLGSSRTWATGFGIMTKMFIRVRAYEFDVSQGSQ